MKKSIPFIFTVTICLFGSSFCNAQEGEQKKQAKNRKAKTAEQQDNENTKSTESKKGNDKTGKKKMTPEELAARKAVLYEFVDTHHPALKRLLKLLEEKRPDEFKRAMKALSNQHARLNRNKEKDPERYRIELKMWKVRSRIEYTSAQLTVDNTEKIEGRLRELLQQQWELKIEMRRLEIERQKAKIDAMREDLAEFRETRSEVLDKQLAQKIAKAKKRSEVLASKKETEKDEQDEAENGKVKPQKGKQRTNL